MYNSEKQLTTRVSKIAYEETFMNVDTPDKSFDPQIGYRFAYPSQWQDNPSAKKVIGLRSLSITPTSHSMTLKIRVFTSAVTGAYDADTDLYANQLGDNINITFSVSKDHDLEHVFALIVQEFENEFDTPATDPVTTNTYLPRFGYEFDAKKDNKLEMYVRNTGGTAVAATSTRSRL